MQYSLQMERIKLGISACLLGDPVRYDGELKLSIYLRDMLGPRVEFVKVCPEVEIGMPVPRPPIRLVGDPGSPRLVKPSTGEDLTRQMERWARRRVEALAELGLRGFIFKARSPSCGLSRVKLYDEQGQHSPRGVGLFARAMQERFPTLAVAEDELFDDPAARDAFLARVGLNISAGEVS